MQLAEYIKKNSFTVTAFAEEIGVARYSLQRYLSGRRALPPPKVIEAVFRATKGEVQPNDFYNLAAKKRTKRKAKAK